MADHALARGLTAVALRVFDVHHDVKNFLITPEIRMRFYRMEVGQVDSRHSHDLGHEIFFILEGRCEVEVEGERATLEPGQACVALRDEMHQVRNVGDTPVLMYLSVSPHVLPTHTYWSADPQVGGQKLPARYNLAYVAQSEQAPATALPDLLDRHLVAVRTLSEAATVVAASHTDLGPELRQLALTGDLAATRIRIDQLWADLLLFLRSVSAVEASWNELAPRFVPPS